MMKKWGHTLIGILFGLLSAGLILLINKPVPSRAILLRPPPTPLPIVVNVDGGVIKPGVYSLPPGSRVFDVVERAGGFSENARPGSINLAAHLIDGAHVYVPIQNQDFDNQTGSVLTMSDTGELINLVNINQASQEELIKLPGIGPVTAQKIIEYREDQAFTRIEDIQKVPGIGPTTYEQIKPFLTVGE